MSKTTAATNPSRAGTGRAAWRWVLLSGGAAIVLAGLWYQRLPPSSRHTMIVFEAENGSNVGYPLEVRHEVPDRSYLRFPASDDQVIVNAKALAPRFPFELPASGNYYLWARTRWLNVCSNSVYLQVDSGPVLMVGNDETFGRWHWVQHPQPVFLEAGRHTLNIPFSEPRIEIDRFVLSDEPYPDFPGAEETGFLDVFATGVPDSWKEPLGGVERVVGAAGCLRIPASTAGHIAYAVRTRPKFAGDLYIRVRARGTVGASGESDLAVLFDYVGPNQYRFVRIGSDGVHLGVAGSGTSDEREVAPLSTASIEAANGRREWDLEVIVEGSSLEVRLGGELLARAPTGERQAGAVGVGSRRGLVDVQSLEVRPAAQPYFQERFYVDKRPLGFIDGFNLVAGKWRKGDVYATPSTYPLEARAFNGPALAVAGERWWSEYRVSTAVRMRPGVQAGIVFHYRDTKNFSMLKVAPGRLEQTPGEMTLVRCRDGACRDVATRPAEFPPDQWSVLGVEAKDSAIRGTLGDRVVIEASEFDGGRGQVGLFADVAAGHSVATTREPSLFLDKRTKAPFSFQAPLTLQPGDSGAALLFHYQGPENYYRFSLLQDAQALEARLDRVSRGHADSLQIARLPRPTGSSQDQDATYNLGVSIHDGALQPYFEGKPLWTVPEGDLVDGVIGVQGLMPASDADFDDFRVTPAGELEATSSLLYMFRPTLAAARDFASWEQSAGSWNIGLSTDDAFLYSLLGRTDSAGIAVFRHREPIPALIRGLFVSLRPQNLQASECEIALHPSDPLKAQQFITLTLAPAQADAGKNRSIPWLTTKIGRTETARQQSEPWLEEGWHNLAVAITSDNELTVTLDDRQVLTAAHPPLGPGAGVSITLRGAEGTVIGFREIRIETAP